MSSRGSRILVATVIDGDLEVDLKKGGAEKHRRRHPSSDESSTSGSSESTSQSSSGTGESSDESVSSGDFGRHMQRDRRIYRRRSSSSDTRGESEESENSNDDMTSIHRRSGSSSPLVREHGLQHDFLDPHRLPRPTPGLGLHDGDKSFGVGDIDGTVLDGGPVVRPERAASRGAGALAQPGDVLPADPSSFRSPASTVSFGGENSDSDLLSDSADQSSRSAESDEESADDDENSDPGESRQGIMRWKRDRSKVLGRGGFGNVYLGINLDTGGMFAAKQIRIDEKNPAQSQKVMTSYHKEIANMQGLTHPNIVRYMGTQLNARMLYIFMELVPGGSIQTLIGKFGKFSETMIRRFTAQIVNGLQYLHDAGIVHRDLKGANILVDQDGLAKLADFGCSKRLSNLTQQGSGFKSVLGTPYWMAPEVIRGVGHGRSADIWSLGCTVIEMANGVPPWCGEFDNPISAMFHIAHNSEVPATPAVLRENPDGGGDDFLQQLCFRREPTERATAADLQRHIFCSGVDVSDVYRGGSGAGPHAGLTRQPTPPLFEVAPVASASAATVVALRVDDPPPPAPGLGQFAVLPRLVLLHVLSFVPPFDLALRCSLVSHAFHELCEDDTIWRYKVRRFWGALARLDAISTADLSASGPSPSAVDSFSSAAESKTMDVQSAHAWRDLFCSLASHEFGWFGTSVLWPGERHGPPSVALPPNDNLSMSSPPATTKASSKPLFAMRRSRSSSSVVVDALRLDFPPLASLRERSFKGKTHVKHTTDMALSADVHFLATSSLDSTVKFWDTHKRKLLRTLSGHDGAVNSVSFLELGNSSESSKSNAAERTKDTDILLLSASEDCTIRLWKITKRHKKYTERGSFIFVRNGHTKSVTAAQPIFFGEKIVSGSNDGTIRIWDVESNLSQPHDSRADSDLSCVTVIENSGSKKGIAWNIPISGLHACNHMVATAGIDGLVKLWDLRMARFTRSFQGHTDRATCVQLDLREGLVISGAADGTLREWDIASGSCVRTFESAGTGVTSLQFDTRKIVAAHADGSVKLWNRFVSSDNRCERSPEASIGRAPRPSDALPFRVLDLHTNVARFSETHLFTNTEPVNDPDSKVRHKSHTTGPRSFQLPEAPPWASDFSLGTVGGAFVESRYVPHVQSPSTVNVSSLTPPNGAGSGSRVRTGSSAKDHSATSGIFGRMKSKKDSKRRDAPFE